MSRPNFESGNLFPELFDENNLRWSKFISGVMGVRYTDECASYRWAPRNSQLHRIQSLLVGSRRRVSFGRDKLKGSSAKLSLSSQPGYVSSCSKHHRHVDGIWASKWMRHERPVLRSPRAHLTSLPCRSVFARLRSEPPVPFPVLYLLGFPAVRGTTAPLSPPPTVGSFTASLSFLGTLDMSSEGERPHDGRSCRFSPALNLTRRWD